MWWIHESFQISICAADLHAQFMTEEKKMLLLERRQSNMLSLSCLADVCQPAQLCTKGHPRITCFINLVFWLSKNLV